MPSNSLVSDDTSHQPLQSTAAGDGWITLACAAVVVAALLATWPFGGLPFDDDASYIFTTKVLAETGHFHLNGWAAAALGPQAYWGALLIKLFGFSFMLIRLGTVPVAAVCGALAYRLGRRCGLRPNLAVLSAFTLVLSPVFLPLAVSFMTDVYGMLFALIALEAVMAAGLSDSTSRAVGWIFLIAAAALLGGTIRQIIAMTALVGLPAVAWRQRDNLAVVAVAAIAWVVVIIGTWLTLRWLAAQPYAIAEIPMLSSLRRGMQHPGQFLAHIGALPLTLSLLTLPVLLIALAMFRWRSPWYWAAAGVVFVVFLVARSRWIIPSSAPWMENILSYYGVFGVYQLGPGRPPLLPGKLWAAISLLVYAVLSMLIVATAAAAFCRSRRWRSEILDSHWIEATLLAFGIAYFLPILPRCAINLAFDRYLLPLIPCVTIPLLLMYQRSGCSARPIGRTMLLAGWVVLALLFIVGDAMTQDDLALGRARVAAVNQLIAAGVPANQIDGGFEYNMWTQLEISGHLNDFRMKNPPNAYNPALPEMPDIEAVYRVEFSHRAKSADEVDTSFRPVRYVSAVPPFHRTLIVRRVIGAEPARSANHSQP